MLANSAPSKRVLGTLNGFAMSAACAARAFGPPIAGVIHAAGLRIGYSGLSWWSCAVVAVVGVYLSSSMTECKNRVQIYTALDEGEVEEL
jgi:H+/Cl- antiporter ClcA